VEEEDQWFRRSVKAGLEEVNVETDGRTLDMSRIYTRWQLFEEGILSHDCAILYFVNLRLQVLVDHFSRGLGYKSWSIISCLMTLRVDVSV
jgi:hypothetical protein